MGLSKLHLVVRPKLSVLLVLRRDRGHEALFISSYLYIHVYPSKDFGIL